MADETKTKQQLIAELEAPGTDREPSNSGSDKPAPTEKRRPALLEPKTRRGLLGWAAPVLLSLGTVLKPGTAHAASTDDFVKPPPPPARKGRCIPTPHASSTPAPSDSSAAPPTAVASAETDPRTEGPAGAADPITSAQRAEGDAPDAGDTRDKRL